MKKLFLAALAAFALVSCQQEQSELNFSEIKGKASVTGRVFYEATSASTGKLESELLPAVGVDVVLEVANAAYTTGAQGNKKYVATTDSTGTYLINGIPVGQKDIEASNVALRIRPFLAQGLEDSVYYELPTSAAPSIKIIANEQTRVEDLTMTLEADNLKNRATVRGKVSYKYGYTQKDGAYIDEVRPAGDVEIVAKFATGSDQEFITKTNAQGEYELVLLVAGSSEQISIYARAFEGEHSKELNGEIVTEDGFYVNLTPVTPTIKPDEVTLADEILMTYQGEALRQMGVLTGTVLYEAGLVEEGGAFEIKQLPADSAELVITIGNDSYTVKTDAEGKYTLNYQFEPNAATSVSADIVPQEYRALYSYVKEHQAALDSATYKYTGASISETIELENVTIAQDIILTTTLNDIDKEEGAAIVKGIVLFDAGYEELSAGQYEIKHIPAPGALVVVEVNGIKYEMKTDQSGAYAITVPVPAQSTVSANLYLGEYRALYSKYDDKELTITTDSATFRFDPSEADPEVLDFVETLTLEPAEEEEVKDKLLGYKDDIEEVLVGPAIITGQVMYTAGYLKDEFGSYVSQDLPAPNAEVKLSVAGKEYWLTTDKDGVYTLVVPMPKDAADKAVSMTEVKEYRSIYTNNLLESDSALFAAAAFPAASLAKEGDSTLLDTLTLIPYAYITPPAEDRVRNVKLELTGTLQVAVEKEVAEVAPFDFNGTKYISGTKASQHGVVVTFAREVYSNYQWTIQERFVYNATPDALGDYKVTADLYADWFETLSSNERVRAYVNVAEIEVADFSHYYYDIKNTRWLVQPVEGVYNADDNYITITGDMVDEGKVTANPLQQSFTITSKIVKNVKGIGNTKHDEDKDGILLYRLSDPFDWGYGIYHY